jgi:hypothetical protein
MTQTVIPVRPIREKIVRTDFFLMTFNQDRLGYGGDKKRVVDLACGHKTLTAAWSRTACPRCTEMLRRSVDDGSVDYDAFRHHGGRDQMIWRDDPLRQFHEPTDLAGNIGQ